MGLHHGNGWQQLFFFSSPRNSSGSGTQDPRSNKLFIVPTIFETIPRVLVRQWIAAVIFYLITKKQQRRRYSRVWRSSTQDASETLDQTNYSLSQPFSKPFQRAWSGNGWRRLFFISSPRNSSGGAAVPKSVARRHSRGGGGRLNVMERSLSRH